MSQLIALDVKPPVDFDFGDSYGKGLNLAQEQQRSQLGAMELEEKKREHSALTAYRDAREADDPNAGDKLKAHPEIYAKFQKAYDSIEDVQEKRTVRKRVKTVGNAARRIAMFPAGSPERMKAGQEEVSRLVKEGHISQEQADAAAKAGYPDLMLKEYVDLGHWADKALPDSKAELAQARIDEVKKRTANADLTAQARIKKIEADIAKVVASTKTEKEQALQIEKLEAQIKALEEQANQRKEGAQAADALEEQRRANAGLANAKAKEVPADSAAERKKDETAAGANVARGNKSQAEADEVPANAASKRKKDEAQADKNSGLQTDDQIEKAAAKVRKDHLPGQFFNEEDLARANKAADDERKRLYKQREDAIAERKAAKDREAAANNKAPGSVKLGTKENPAIPSSKADLDKLQKGDYYRYKGKLYQKN